MKYAEKKMTKYNINESDLITELCSGPYYMKKTYEKSWFKDSVFVDFEDTKMPIPIGYDGYLKTAFGEYMKLPPKEKQHPHHEFIFVDLYNGYKEHEEKWR